MSTPDLKNVDSYLEKLPPQNNVFCFNMIGKSDVINAIDTLNNSNSSVIDNISNKVVKIIKNIIALPITTIINDSLILGSFPDKLKTAKVKPLYKKNDPSTYRPISLLPVISKIFEKMIHRQLIHFTNYNILSDYQFSFRPKYSTEHAALQFHDYIIHQLDEGKTPFCKFIDLSKAFDTIDHSISIEKLRYYGIQNTAGEFLISYLSNRKQCVLFNHELSDLSNVCTGVPHGSILGPLLFLIYINDLPFFIKKT